MVYTLLVEIYKITAVFPKEENTACPAKCEIQLIYYHASSSYI